MKVYFIGAGPGASDLITLRGANILGRVRMVLYAGSLVPLGMLQHCRDAELIDTAKLDLDEQEACYRRAQATGYDVARLHSGDPAIYGATAEQMRRLDALNIEYEIVPGVSSFTAAAAAIKAELTKPEVSQTVILTRVSGRASAVPELEAIARLAEHRASMCIFLSGPHLKKIVADLQSRVCCGQVLPLHFARFAVDAGRADLSLQQDRRQFRDTRFSSGCDTDGRANSDLHRILYRLRG